MKEDVTIIIGSGDDTEIIKGFTDDFGKLKPTINLYVSDETHFEMINLVIDLQTEVIDRNYNTGEIPKILAIQEGNKPVFIDRMLRSYIKSIIKIGGKVKMEPIKRKNTPTALIAFETNDPNAKAEDYTMVVNFFAADKTQVLWQREQQLTPENNSGILFEFTQQDTDYTEGDYYFNVDYVGNTNGKFWTAIDKEPVKIT